MNFIALNLALVGVHSTVDQRDYKNQEESVLTLELALLGEPDDAPASGVPTLLDRCKLRLVQRDYEGARQVCLCHELVRLQCSSGYSMLQ